MPRLRIENLSKAFSIGRARITALDRLSLEVEDGELVVILGPSGCGKTTLLRIIAGLEQSDSGDVIAGADSLVRTSPRERKVGFAFQFPALLPQLTVAENICLGPKLRGIPSAERNARVERLAELLGINDLLVRLPETLSGGQQQRVSLARALATEPALLLLDEPLASLDPFSRAELREVIRSAQRELKVTTIYVTHDQSEAAAVGDRIAILRSGTLQQIGRAEEVYHDPANLFVTEFLAPERPNVLRGEVRDGVFRPGGASFAIATTLQVKGEVICVIRPSAILPNGKARGTIVESIRTGWSNTVLIDADGVRLRASLPLEKNLSRGDEFIFTIAPSGILYFDVTGRRLR